MMGFQRWVYGLAVGTAISLSAAVARAGCPSDGDGDGVCDGSDRCPNTIPGITVNAQGCPRTAPGDFDGDGDVDDADYAQMAACLLGPAGPTGAAAPCPDADFDFDLDVDLRDLVAFEHCFSGTDVPADPDCLPHTAGIVNGCLRIVGTGASTDLALRLSPVVPSLLQVDVGDDGTPDFSFNRTLFFCINVFARGGHDVVRIDETFGMFTDTEITTLDGGSGNDTLLGGAGMETFFGGAGDDFVDGGPGADTAHLGAGDDTFQWDPGDGSDVVNGQGGDDILLFNGSNAAETFTLAPNGTRVLLFRDVANIQMDLNGIENVGLNVFGGTDAVTVHSLAGTDVTDVRIDLAAVPGGVTGDALVDFVVVNATPGADDIGISGVAGEVTVAGLAANVHVVGADASLDQLLINAFAGDDTVDASALPAGLIRLSVSGGLDHDTLIGSAGVDTLSGNEGNDTITGGPGDDVILLGLGDDLFIWNPGDGSDRIEGETGVDTVEVNGGNGDEVFTATANGTRVRFDRLMPAPFFLDIGDCDHLILNANGGDDSFSATGNLSVLIALTIDGGPGKDTLLGSNGVDLLIGGDDDDFIDGQQGNDTILLGDGDDTFRWDPGDGSDVVEGQAGHDTMIFNGSAAAEIFEFTANGARLRFARNVGNIIMDVDGVEQVNLFALGGADVIVANDLAGTAVTDIHVGLAGVIGGMTGDGLADSVIINGTSGPDNITITGAGASATVTGLSAGVTVSVADSALDSLTINALGGHDHVQATGLPGEIIKLTLSGGMGDDMLIGSGGDDMLFGDEDNDTLLGSDGNDTAFLGLGDDLFIWNPGDGSDRVEGQTGTDTVEINGGNGDEVFTATANGGEVRFDRISPAPFFIDILDCDHLILNANGGDDSFSATGNLSALIAFTIDGGPGNDTLLGSNGADILIGGDDNDFLDGQQGGDFLLGGLGDDTFRWDPGDGSDTIEGQEGFDTLVFNASNAAEIMNLAANGARLRLTRNVASIVMDCDDVEQVDLAALGGADSITIDDLSATDVIQVNVQLAGTIGGGMGDAQSDSVIVNATDNDDFLFVDQLAGAVRVLGLAAQVNILTSEAAFDTLRVNLLAGDDVLDASGLAAGFILLTVDGGDDNDVITGSDGPDVLLGGNGDDVLIGGLGLDILDGGPGDNILIQ